MYVFLSSRQDVHVCLITLKLIFNVKYSWVIQVEIQYGAAEFV